MTTATAAQTAVTTLYMSKLTINPMSVGLIGNSYRMHQALRPAAPDRVGNPKESRGAVVDGKEVRDFLWRLDASDDKIEVLVQSACYTEWGKLVDSGVVTDVQQKVWRPRIQSGTPLMFRLRASPFRKHHKYVDENTRRKWRVSIKNRDDQEAWLAKRLARAGEILSLMAVGWREPDAVKHDKHDASRSHTFNDILVDYEGSFVVRNEAEAMRLIRDGIGPGKSVGLGLLAVSLPARA